MKKVVVFLFLLAIGSSCTTQADGSNPLEMALASEDPKIKRVMETVEAHEVQIRYTQIDRVNDSIVFTDYDFQVNDQDYFYPASTAKFPTAVLALERIHQTDSLTVNTKYYVEGDTIESTVAQDISEIFSVSDNLANNRLVELLGQDFINARLTEKGISPVRISHRLGYHSDDLKTKPWIIYMNDSTTGISKPTINTSPKALHLERIQKGTGYYEDDALIQKPFDFSLKNYYPITTQHGLLKRVIFPDQFTADQQFDLGSEERQLLLNAMHTVPRKVGYDPETYYDGYCKFLMYGDTKEHIPEYLEIYNKVGFAYGTLTDCAYIKDTKNNIDFLVTATILVNKDGIFNDDAYDYEEIGIPFLAQLGRELYQQELQRH